VAMCPERAASRNHALCPDSNTVAVWYTQKAELLLQNTTSIERIICDKDMHRKTKKLFGKIFCALARIALTTLVANALILTQKMIARRRSN
jgi:hypothetical protein